MVLVYILLLLPGGIDKIAKSNEYKKAAQEAFNAKNYSSAASKFIYLLDTLGIKDEQIQLNLAHTYFKLEDTSSAITQYGKLLSSNNLEIASIANQQLGVIKAKSGQIDLAVAYMKTAIKQNPLNEEARFNYELLKRLQQNPQANNQNNNQKENKSPDKKGDQKQDQKGGGDKKSDDKNNSGGSKDQKSSKDNKSSKDGNQSKMNDPNKTESNNKSGNEQGKKKEEESGKGGKEKKDQNDKNGKDKKDKNSGGEKEEGEKDKKAKGEDGDKQNIEDIESGQSKGKGKKGAESMQANPERLQQMNLSQDKAKMLLDAIKNTEGQYLQQMKRDNGSVPKVKKDKNKPDW